MLPAHPHAAWSSVVLVLGLVAPTVPAADPRAGPAIHSMHVTPAVGFEGTDLRVLVRITPHADERRLSLVVEGPRFYASTERQLDGEASARAHLFAWRQLPTGDYRITATLTCVNRSGITLSRAMQVLGRPERERSTEP
jgi:hypothetical protein